MKRITRFAFFLMLCIALISIGLSGCVIVHFTDRNTVRGRGDRDNFEISTEWADLNS